MNLLFDTPTLLWTLLEDPRLKSRHKDMVQDRRNRLFVSAVSVFEISTKARIGKLPEARILEKEIEHLSANFDYIDIFVTPAHAALAGRLQSPHRDPFDRLLAAQSLIESLPIMTNDPIFSDFGVATIW